MPIAEFLFPDINSLPHFPQKIFGDSKINHYLCKRSKNTTIMEKKNFKDYTDEEFKAAMEATLKLKDKWLESVRIHEKELGLAWDDNKVTYMQNLHSHSWNIVNILYSKTSKKKDLKQIINNEKTIYNIMFTHLLQY